MIIYNWELAIKFLVIWFFINAVGLLLLGVMHIEKKKYYDRWDVGSALFLIALLIIPVFA